MSVKQSVRYFLLALACFSLTAVAQDSSQTNITGSGTKGKIAVFTGTHSVGNSIMHQASGNVDVSGGVSATKGGSSANNTVTGNNTQTDSLGAGAAVFGETSTSGESNTGSAWGNGAGGTWGDGGKNDSSTGLANYAVIGTTDNKAAGIFQANGGSYYTLFGYNFATGSTGYMFAVDNGDGAGCNIDPEGDLSCTGSKNAVVPVDGGKHQVALAAIESPKNWFEDFGSAQLVGGVATVRFDARFIQTVNSGVEYHVFLTPNGDCKGLYVNQKTATDFEVRELGNGTSNVKFDYRITALRKNYEKVRFADHSREFPLLPDGSIRPAQK
ncbi:MAG TPA: hypothetical protein VGP35_10265 [Terriglobales bacterium]|jgi:hypothetical protein|nr:hypothetical protein [Terriglobales bacterium]